MLLVGLAIFTLASAVCGAAHSTAVLDWARALQGAGAALQLSSAMAIVSHDFRGRERARAFAFWGSVIGVAIMLGPVAGGFLTQMLGWQWAFYVNLPVGVAMIVLTYHAVQESKDPDAIRIDVAGVATFSAFLGLLTLALINGNHAGWTSGHIVIELAASVGFFAAFIFVEAVQKRPMIDLSYFRRRTYLRENIRRICRCLPDDADLSALVLSGRARLFAARGRTSDAAARDPTLCRSAHSRRLSRPSTFGSRVACDWTCVRGWWAVSYGNRNSGVQLRPNCGTMFIASIGAGILNGQVTKVGMTVIPPERAGMGSGVSGTMRFGGIVVGFAALGAVLFHRIRENVSSALPTLTDTARLAITRAVADGDLSTATSLSRASGGAVLLARESMGLGYEGVLLCASMIALMATVLCFGLVSPHETAPRRKGVVCNDGSLRLPRCSSSLNLNAGSYNFGSAIGPARSSVIHKKHAGQLF
jgi:hypothetical protein